MNAPKPILSLKRKPAVDGIPATSMPASRPSSTSSTATTSTPTPIPDPESLWECVCLLRRLTGLPLHGLPATESDPVLPLIPKSDAGLPVRVRKLLKRIRMSRSYTTACLEAVVAVHVITGEQQPIAEQQRLDARKRATKCGWFPPSTTEET